MDRGGKNRYVLPCYRIKCQCVNLFNVKNVKRIDIKNDVSNFVTISSVSVRSMAENRLG